MMETSLEQNISLAEKILEVLINQEAIIALNALSLAMRGLAEQVPPHGLITWVEIEMILEEARHG